MVEGWKRVTTALEPFADRSVQKPQSVEDVDSAIDMIENQFESLEVRITICSGFTSIVKIQLHHLCALCRKPCIDTFAISPII